jgi:hypothetical protein
MTLSDPFVNMQRETDFACHSLRGGMCPFEVACVDGIEPLPSLREVLDVASERAGLFNARLVQANVFPALHAPLCVPRSFTMSY